MAFPQWTMGMAPPGLLRTILVCRGPKSTVRNGSRLALTVTVPNVSDTYTGRVDAALSASRSPPLLMSKVTPPSSGIRA